MTDKDRILALVESLKEASRHACPGPWMINTVGSAAEPEILTNQSHPLCKLSNSFHRQCEHGPGNDAEFIVMARNAMPFLTYALREFTWIISDIAEGKFDSLNCQISADSVLSRVADTLK